MFSNCSNYHALCYDPYFIKDSVKGIIKLAVWVVAFVVPAGYLREKAKTELSEDSSS